MKRIMEKSEYYKYLASREWSMLKARVKKRSRGYCERCHVGTYAYTHHLTYERIGKERLDDLQGVCGPCHKFLHGESNFDREKAITTLLQMTESIPGTMEFSTDDRIISLHIKCDEVEGFAGMRIIVCVHSNEPGTYSAKTIIETDVDSGKDTKHQAGIFSPSRPLLS